jgi:hypothetical protein
VQYCSPVRLQPVPEAEDELAPFWVYDLRRYESGKPLPLRIVGQGVSLEVSEDYV